MERNDKVIETAFDLLITKNSWFDPENPKTAPTRFCDYKFFQGNTMLHKKTNLDAKKEVSSQVYCAVL